MDLGQYLGIHVNALTLREKRASQIANNIANVDTPHYKAQDFNFQDALKSSMSSESTVGLNITNPNHMSASENSASGIEMQYRVPFHVSLDGNTVDKDMEITEFSKNSLAYSASLTFLDAKIKSLITAIRGE